MKKNSLMRIGLLAAIAFLPSLSSLFALEINPGQYRKAEAEKTPVPRVINPSFEEGETGWKLAGKYTIGRGFGTLASGGLLMERSDPKEYYMSTQNLKLQPGRIYNFSIMIRSEDVKCGDPRGGTFAVEFSSKDKWISGAYPNGLKGTTDWTKIEINHLKVPENAVNTQVTLYMGKGCTGKVFYDELTVTPADMKWTVYPLNAPMSIIAPGKKLRLSFSKDGKSIMGSAEPGSLAVCCEFNGRRMSAPILDDQAVLPLPEDLEGSGEMKVTVVDTARKLILEETAVPLTVKPLPDPQPAASCRIDEQGYTLVNGRRFLPIGLFCTAEYTWELAKIRETGFNTILPYNSLSMGFSKKEAGWERIGEVFDYCEKHDMKILFCLKNVYRNTQWSLTSLYGEPTPNDIVKKTALLFRNRPALLGYYVCDELPEQMIPEVMERRNLLNSLDPEHPVWVLAAIGFNADSIKNYCPAADVVGTDTYPILKEGSSLKKMEKYLRETAEGGLPFWIVPQMFSWRRYPTSVPQGDTCRFPSADEFRTMILLSAGYEARGYIFYDSKALCRPVPKLDGDTEENLKTIRQGIGMLRDLEPFLTSGQPVKKLPVRILKGDVRAWEFSDGMGGRRVAVVSLGPDPAEAEITVDFPDQLHSRYGKTEWKDGKWIFRAEQIDSDLLGGK